MPECLVLTGALVAVVAIMGVVSAGLNVRVTFLKIADFNTPVPEGAGSFPTFGAPSFADGAVAFNGAGETPPGCLTSEGIYIYQASQLNMVVNGCTLVPGYPGGLMFVAFSQPAVGVGNVTFTGAADHARCYCRGIYNWHADEGLTIVADPSTPDPGGYGYLDEFFTVSRDGGSLGFTAWTSMCTHGVYVSTNIGDIALVANWDTKIPGGEGAFSAFGFHVTVGEGIVAFTGGTSDHKQWGVYASQAGVTKIADKNTSIPGGTGMFTDFGDWPSTDGGCVAFYGEQIGVGQIDQKGIYTNLGGQLRVVADLNTPIPDGTGSFTAFRSLLWPGMGIDNARVAFRGEGPGGQVGIYCEINGQLIKVIDLTEKSLEAGKTLRALEIDEQCLDGNRLGFYAEFEGGTPGEYFAGVYVATLSNDGN